VVCSLDSGLPTLLRRRLCCDAATLGVATVELWHIHHAPRCALCSSGQRRRQRTAPSCPQSAATPWTVRCHRGTVAGSATTSRAPTPPPTLRAATRTSGSGAAGAATASTARSLVMWPRPACGKARALLCLTTIILCLTARAFHAQVLSGLLHWLRIVRWRRVQPQLPRPLRQRLQTDEQRAVLPDHQPERHCDVQRRRVPAQPMASPGQRPGVRRVWHGRWRAYVGEHGPILRRHRTRKARRPGLARPPVLPYRRGVAGGRGGRGEVEPASRPRRRVPVPVRC
jgi:hypothetical protein